MKERPILMSGPMVRAILDGRKTQTRRVVRPQPIAGPLPGGKYEATSPWVDTNGEWHFMRGVACRGEDDLGRCPYGQPGDRLWVRENFWRDERDSGVVIFDATCEFGKYRLGDGKVVRSSYPNTSNTGERPSREQMEREMETNRFWSRKPSIHMPRWASRLTLELTEVRVEQLKDISDDDAKAEGYVSHIAFLTGDFAHSIPDATWLWALSFKVVTP